jgi:hypothetical protein
VKAGALGLRPAAAAPAELRSLRAGCIEEPGRPVWSGLKQGCGGWLNCVVELELQAVPAMGKLKNPVTSRSQFSSSALRLGRNGNYADRRTGLCKAEAVGAEKFQCVSPVGGSFPHLLSNQRHSRLWGRTSQRQPSPQNIPDDFSLHVSMQGDRLVPFGRIYLSLFLSTLPSLFYNIFVKEALRREIWETRPNSRHHSRETLPAIGIR